MPDRDQTDNTVAVGVYDKNKETSKWWKVPFVSYQKPYLRLKDLTYLQRRDSDNTLQDYLEFASTVDAPPKPRPRPRTRLALPITLDPEGAAATVLACADTGADVNVISEELAQILCLTDYQPCTDDGQLMLANGKIIKALGTITTQCAFGTELTMRSVYSCIFHVLRKTISPLIMGANFLTSTSTMTKHQERLIQVPRLPFQALSIRSIGRPRDRMSCEIGGRTVWAFPDSGSDINLMAPEFALALGLPVYEGAERLQMADGTVVITSGFAQTALTIESKAPARSIVSTIVDFLILDSFHHSVIVGGDSLARLEAFTENQHVISPDPYYYGILELNRIRVLESLDHVVEWVKEQIAGRRVEPTTHGMYPSSQHHMTYASIL